MSAPGTKSSRWKRPRPNAWLVVVPIAYGLLLAVFSSVGDRRGLVTPSGSVDVWFLALGLATLLARIAVLFVVPLVAAYRVIAWLLDRATRPVE